MRTVLKGKTGVLDIILPTDRRTITWNGVVEEREQAKAVFESLLKGGWVLASVLTEPGKAEMVRSWAEVEQKEKQEGTVAVVISPQIQGG